jgi:hypothetical protein
MITCATLIAGCSLLVLGTQSNIGDRAIADDLKFYVSKICDELHLMTSGQSPVGSRL